MSLKRFRHIIFAFLSLAATTAQAEIVIFPGQYNLVALIRPLAKTKQIEAVFNFRSRSECRVRFSGPKAAALAITRPVGRWIRFEVKNKTVCGVADAELLGVAGLEGRRIPLRVGNGFAEIESDRDGR